jgi:peptidoglycan/xylan/chitin deacetylase (PgdA/CDA1 family)
MKKLFGHSSFRRSMGIFLLLAATVTGRAGSVAAPYEIATWAGFRSAAITYTFDDNLPNQYAVAVPMFHAAGFKMTLFTVVNSWDSSFTWSKAQTAAAYGDEIASHTMTHLNLTTVNAEQLTNDLANSRSNINARITNALCVTLAYPYCAVPREAVTAQYYIAARSCSGQLVPATPTDFFDISSFGCGSQGPVRTAAQFNGLVDQAAASNAWCVYLIHAIDNDNGYSPLPGATLQASLDYLGASPDKFWVETFGNVVRYIQERNASSVIETLTASNRITLQVTNSLDRAIFDYPLTLRRPLPAGWPSAAVSQNNRPVTAKCVTLNSTHYVMFDVVPNGGEVVLRKTD